MCHLSEVVYSFYGISLNICVHSLVASQLLYPPRSIQGQGTALGGEGESVKKVQKTLIEQLARAVESRARLQEKAPCGFDARAISNLLWALAKLVENGLFQLDQGGLASQTVTALLPQVQSHQDDFTSQGGSNLLWSLAKLVENGLLQQDQGFLAQPGGNGAVAAGGNPSGTGSYPQANLQPAVGTGETGGERTAPAGSGRSGQPGGDGTVAAGGDFSRTV